MFGLAAIQVRMWMSNYIPYEYRDMLFTSSRSAKKHQMLVWLLWMVWIVIWTSIPKLINNTYDFFLCISCYFPTLQSVPVTTGVLIAKTSATVWDPVMAELGTVLLDASQARWGPLVRTVSFHVDGFVQERHNASVLTMKLRHSCANPSMWYKYEQ